MNRIPVDAIPKTISYITDCFEDISCDFSIIISYSDYTFSRNVVHMIYVHENASSDYRYNIDISKQKNKDGREHLFECKYSNNKYVTSFSHDNKFTIKNIGGTPSIDDILVEALVFVNRKRKIHLD